MTTSTTFFPREAWYFVFVLDFRTHEIVRLSILFSQYRSCDYTKEVWTFVVFIEKTACDKENVPLWKEILSWVSSRDLYWEDKKGLFVSLDWKQPVLHFLAFFFPIFFFVCLRKNILVTTTIMLCTEDVLHEDVLMILDELPKTHIFKSRSHEDDFFSKFCCDGATDNTFSACVTCYGQLRLRMT